MGVLLFVSFLLPGGCCVVPFGHLVQFLKLLHDFVGFDFALLLNFEDLLEPMVHIVELHQLLEPLDELFIPAGLQILNIIADEIEASEGVATSQPVELLRRGYVIELEAEFLQVGELLEALQGAQVAVVQGQGGYQRKRGRQQGYTPYRVVAQGHRRAASLLSVFVQHQLPEFHPNEFYIGLWLLIQAQLWDIPCCAVNIRYDFESPKGENPKTKPKVEKADASVLQRGPIELGLDQHQHDLLIEASVAVPVRGAGRRGPLAADELHFLPVQLCVFPVRVLREHDADGPHAGQLDSESQVQPADRALLREVRDQMMYIRNQSSADVRSRAQSLLDLREGNTWLG